MGAGDESGYTSEAPEFRRITIALFLAGLATFATLYCTQPLLPVLSQRFAVTPATSALSVSLTTISLGVSLLFVGPVSDAVGRLPVMITSLLASGVVTMASGLATSWPVFLGLRCLLGVVVAGLPAVAVAYLREEMHPGAAARATGVYIGGTALGGMAGRLITGAVADVLGWHAAIVTIGAVALACGIAVHLLLPRSRGFVPASLHPAELRRGLMAILRDPVLVGLMAVAFLAMGGFVAVFNAMGFRLVAAPYRLSVGWSGLVFLVYAFGSWSSARAGRLAPTHGASRVALSGFAVALAGIAVTALTPLPMVVLGLALLSVGFFAGHGVASGWVTARAMDRGLGAGQAASLYLFAYYLGSSVMGTAGGAAWSSGGWGHVTWLTGSLYAVAIVVVALLHRSTSGPRHASAQR